MPGRPWPLAVVRVTGYTALSFAALGTLLSLTVRDRYVPLAAIYYATPWLIRFLAASLALLLLTGRRKAWPVAAICAGFALFDASRSYQPGSTAVYATPAALRCRFWNAAGGLGERRDLWSLQSDADILAFVETGRFSAGKFADFQKANPLHEWKILGKGEMIGVRGKILATETLGEKGRFRCHRVLADIDGAGRVPVLVVDVLSDVRIPRLPSLSAILEIAGKDPATIILGDFNTPVDSAGFDAWHEAGFSLANKASRNSFLETWAFGIPLHTLDHIWIGGKWRARSAFQSRPDFDHDQVEVTISPR